jgi:hypothetical protein
VLGKGFDSEVVVGGVALVDRDGDEVDNTSDRGDTDSTPVIVVV